MEPGQGLEDPAAVRAVSFDAGGTLLEPWPSVGHIYAAVAAEHGRPGLAPEVLNRQFAAAWRAQPQFGHTRAEWAALVDQAFRGLVPLPPSESFFPALYERFDDPRSWRIYDDVRPALEELRARGLALALISNWDERLRPLLRRLDLEGYFKEIVVSCEEGCCKPAPQIFAAASARLGLPPAAILHVGDSRTMDVEGARAAGFQALWLRRAMRADSPPSQDEITSLSCLVERLDDSRA